jgi:hypothetical protein
MRHDLVLRLLWISAATLTACGPEPVQLTVDQGQYAPDATAELRLENGTWRAINYNLCGATA